MHWKNYSLIKAKNYDADHFTSDFGIKFRRFIHPLIRLAIGAALDRPVEIVRYPELLPNENYIFAAGHSFPGEAASNLFGIDRNTWVLVGTTDQVDHNPQMLVAWANGLIYVDKFSSESRRDAQKKIKRILKNGSSVLIFPEGVLNNSENLLCMPLYPGVYHMTTEMNVKVVPIVSHTEHKANKILIAAGDPLDFSGKGKEKSMEELRDTLAALRFELIEKFPKLERSTLSGDIHMQHLKNRRDIYLETKWIEPNWDEEIMTYHRKDITNPEEVRASFDIVKITAENAKIITPILIQRELDLKYNITQYMKDHWNDVQQSF